LRPTEKSLTFEFGDTNATKAFLKRNQKFLPKFERLMDLGNKCFGRAPRPTSRGEDIASGWGIHAGKTGWKFYFSAPTVIAMMD